MRNSVQGRVKKGQGYRGPYPRPLVLLRRARCRPSSIRPRLGRDEKGHWYRGPYPRPFGAFCYCYVGHLPIALHMFLSTSLVLRTELCTTFPNRSLELWAVGVSYISSKWFQGSSFFKSCSTTLQSTNLLVSAKGRTVLPFSDLFNLFQKCKITFDCKRFNFKWLHLFLCIILSCSYVRSVSGSAQRLWGRKRI